MSNLIDLFTNATTADHATAAAQATACVLAILLARFIFRAGDRGGAA